MITLRQPWRNFPNEKIAWINKKHFLILPSLKGGKGNMDVAKLDTSLVTLVAILSKFRLRRVHQFEVGPLEEERYYMACAR